jgi:hypothetical protein
MARRSLIVFILALIGGALADGYVIVLSDRRWTASVFLSLTLPYLNYLYNVWWTDESGNDKHRNRLILLTAGALGSAGGVLAAAAVFTLLE